MKFNDEKKTQINIEKTMRHGHYNEETKKKK